VGKDRSLQWLKPVLTFLYYSMKQLFCIVRSASTRVSCLVTKRFPFFILSLLRSMYFPSLHLTCLLNGLLFTILIFNPSKESSCQPCVTHLQNILSLISPYLISLFVEIIESALHINCLNFISQATFHSWMQIFLSSFNSTTYKNKLLSFSI